MPDFHHHADLIFLHLTRQQVHPHQPRPAPGRACAYLTPKGCRLPRLSRPWLCTWYICPAQTLRLSRESRGTLEGKILEIKALRREMEAAYIRAVAGR